MNAADLIARSHRACLFALRLRLELDTIGATQKWLADRTGLSPAFVSRMLGGDRVPSLHSLDKLARVFGVPVQTLWRDGT